VWHVHYIFQVILKFCVGKQSYLWLCYKCSLCSVMTNKNQTVFAVNDAKLGETRIPSYSPNLNLRLLWVLVEIKWANKNVFHSNLTYGVQIMWHLFWTRQKTSTNFETAIGWEHNVRNNYRVTYSIKFSRKMKNKRRHRSNHS